MKNWSKGRVALVGDAAFCVSLMAGQGSALAMAAAYVLAGELANASGRDEVASRRYEALLRAYIGSKQAGAERFSTAFAPKVDGGCSCAIKQSGRAQPWAGKAGFWPRYNRYPATPQLRLASACTNRDLDGVA
jgi:2-polyprenyl-6-methoxyphenol hydroxylase-like FAD-dependent oxidoreductase